MEVAPGDEEAVFINSDRQLRQGVAGVVFEQQVLTVTGAGWGAADAVALRLGAAAPLLRFAPDASAAALELLPWSLP